MTCRISQWWWCIQHKQHRPVGPSSRWIQFQCHHCCEQPGCVQCWASMKSFLFRTCSVIIKFSGTCIIQPYTWWQRLGIRRSASFIFGKGTQRLCGPWINRQRDVDSRSHCGWRRLWHSDNWHPWAQLLLQWVGHPLLYSGYQGYICSFKDRFVEICFKIIFMMLNEAQVMNELNEIGIDKIIWSNSLFNVRHEGSWNGWPWQEVNIRIMIFVPPIDFTTKIVYLLCEGCK